MLFVSHTVKYAHTNGQIAWKCVPAGGGGMVLSLVFFSRAGRDWWQEDYWGSERWNQDEEELWTVWVRLLHTPENLKIQSFPHRLTLSVILSGQAVKRYPLRSDWAPREIPEDWNVEKDGWTFSMVQSCENPGVLSETFLPERLRESQVGRRQEKSCLAQHKEHSEKWDLICWA